MNTNWHALRAALPRPDIESTKDALIDNSIEIAIELMRRLGVHEDTEDPEFEDARSELAAWIELALLGAQMYSSGEPLRQVAQYMDRRGEKSSQDILVAGGVKLRVDAEMIAGTDGSPCVALTLSTDAPVDLTVVQVTGGPAEETPPQLPKATHEQVTALVRLYFTAHPGETAMPGQLARYIQNHFSEAGLTWDPPHQLKAAVLGLVDARWLVRVGFTPLAFKQVTP